MGHPHVGRAARSISLSFRKALGPVRAQQVWLCFSHVLPSRSVFFLRSPNLEVDCKMQNGADVTTEKKKTGLKGKDVIIEYYTVSPFPVCQTACSGL